VLESITNGAAIIAWPWRINTALNQMVGSMLANRALTLLHDRGGDCHFEL